MHDEVDFLHVEGITCSGDELKNIGLKKTLLFIGMCFFRHLSRVESPHH